jgi:hypothetical protein
MLLGIVGIVLALRAATIVTRENRCMAYAVLAGCISAVLNAVLFAFWPAA